MDRIHKQSDRTLDEVEHIAVVIGEPGLNQRHTGILYRISDSDPLGFLHLEGHCRLFCEASVKPEFSWVAPRINKLRLVQLAGICDAIASENASNSIPYGLSAPVGVFDNATKRFLLGPTEGGLTCASFVLAVFDNAQLQLVKYSGWPPPDAEDYQWQENVLKHLRDLRSKHPDLVSKEHIDCVQSEVGTSVRYRPEQVAAASAIRERRPVKYRYARALGEQIVNLLRGNPFGSTMQYSAWDRIVRWFDRMRY